METWGWQTWQLIGLCFMALSYAIILFVADVYFDGKDKGD